MPLHPCWIEFACDVRQVQGVHASLTNLLQETKFRGTVTEFSETMRGQKTVVYKARITFVHNTPDVAVFFLALETSLPENCVRFVGWDFPKHQPEDVN